MKNCLVTKLNAAADNDNLPILDVINEFGLAAVAASGNNAMTEEQVWHVSRFFNRLGATTNSALWQKITCVYLPLIADDIDYGFVDYKNSFTKRFVPSDTILQLANHGVSTIYSNASNALNTDSRLLNNNYGMFVSFNSALTTNSFTSNEKETPFQIKYLVNGVFTGNQSSLMFVTSGTQQRIAFKNNSNGLRAGFNFSINGTETEMMYCITGEESISQKLLLRTANNVVVRNFRGTTSYGTGRYWDSSSASATFTFVTRNILPGISVIIAGEAFSDEEAETIFEAVTTLKKAFITE